MKQLFIFFMILFGGLQLSAQKFEQSNDPMNMQSNRKNHQTDSTGSNKEIPKGLKEWVVDTKFGERKPVIPDTLSHMFMNTNAAWGLRGDYNTLGNLGGARINRLFIDRPLGEQFIFTQPYEYFVKPIDKFHFTNTLSPLTNLSYHSMGDKTDGDDHLVAKFGVNAGKKIGVGFLFDYIYNRGIYQNQNTAHFNYTMYGSYIGDRYQAHLLLSTYHQKASENGGITDDNYITHPESFNENFQPAEIPTTLSQNWNRNDHQHVFFSHRYNIGFNRKVRMSEDEIKAKKFAMAAQKEKAAKNKEDKNSEENGAQGKQPVFEGRPKGAVVAGDEPQDTTQAKPTRIRILNQAMADSLNDAAKKAAEDSLWLKNEYVPVTSFIHTLQVDNYRRIYQAYETPESFYAHQYNQVGKLAGDSIFDQTKHLAIKNTFAISLLEGFNKWAKAGLKAFISSDMRHFSLPDSLGGYTSFNEHNLSVGGQLSKTQGKSLHYQITGETFIAGKDAGSLKFDGSVDLNFPLFGDTVTLAASGFIHHTNPTFYFRHYHSKHFWWDNDDLSNIFHTRVEGLFHYRKTRTTLRVAADEIKNYTYMGVTYDQTGNESISNLQLSVLQYSTPLTVFTASLSQDFAWGPIHWENVFTYQKSLNNDVLPLPTINIYSNLFFRFKIAHVLKCDLGADVRYFSAYRAPEYQPGIGQFVVNGNAQGTEVGNYPFVNAYANFHLKNTRFYIMMSHLNGGIGKRNYFLTPHYPTAGRVLELGLSWDFYN